MHSELSLRVIWGVFASLQYYVQVLEITQFVKLTCAKLICNSFPPPPPQHKPFTQTPNFPCHSRSRIRHLIRHITHIFIEFSSDETGCCGSHTEQVNGTCLKILTPFWSYNHWTSGMLRPFIGKAVLIKVVPEYRVTLQNKKRRFKRAENVYNRAGLNSLKNFEDYWPCP